MCAKYSWFVHTCRGRERASLASPPHQISKRMNFYARISRIVTRALTALAFGACLFAAGAQEGPAPPWIKDPGLKVYREKYLAGASHKAFAIAESGQFGWAEKRDTAGRAAQIALLECIRQAPTARCTLFSVDGNVMIDFYQIAASDTAAVQARMKPPRELTFGDEAKDTGVAPTYDPRAGNLVAPTPPTSPYALNLSTGALAELLAGTNRPIVLDVTEPGKEYKKNAIPGATWIGGAGIHDEKSNPQTDRFLARIMGQLASTKEWPLVVYCADWQCWEAYNAMQRLYTLGYHKLYWYRGGIAAWTRAGLPVVEAPLSAQVAPLK